MPELRASADPGRQELFVVVQDAFLTETAELADVVLPAAIWGEKTGTFTNADRTVHLSDKAVDPPGEARTDSTSFSTLRDGWASATADGAPLIGWEDPEAAFEAWRRFGAPYGLFVLGSLAIPLSYPTVGYPLLSMPRFSCRSSPPSSPSRQWRRPTRRERAVLIVSSLFLGVAVVEWSVGQWVS